MGKKETAYDRNAAANGTGSAVKEETLRSGAYGADYHAGRLTKRQLKYRLRRRTEEVNLALQAYCNKPAKLIIDIAAADGLMLEDIGKQQPDDAVLIGLDISLPLLRAHTGNRILTAQADCVAIPLADSTADAVIATAVIEHLPDPEAMVGECRRVLRTGGIMILTTPDPFLDHIATLVGLVDDPGHCSGFRLKDLKRLAETFEFDVLEHKKFMFSPIGFPAEKLIERILGPVGLNLLMANQLAVWRKL